jgi:hypothetical protein
MTAQPDLQLVRELSADAQRRMFASVGEHIAATITDRGLTPDPGGALWAAIDEWLPRPLTTPEELTAEQEQELRERWDASVAGARHFAWHELRLFCGPALLDESDVDQYEIGHATECATLPPGAACWAVRDPFRWWWPTARGTYRIRPEDVLTGGDEAGPDWDVTLRVQVRGEAGGWADYDGDTAGAEPTDDEYPAIVERLKTLIVEKAAATAAEQAERDADVRAAAAVVRAREGHEEGRALNSLAARFHGRIAELEARTTDGGAS